jgi:Transposase
VPADVPAFEQDVLWAVDVADGLAARWINLLLKLGQRLVYLPALALNRAAAYRGTGKTDAKDASVLAEQARMRGDLTILQPKDEHAAQLGIRTGRRADLGADRTRAINPCSAPQHFPGPGTGHRRASWRAVPGRHRRRPWPLGRS